MPENVFSLDFLFFHLSVVFDSISFRYALILMQKSCCYFTSLICLFTRVHLLIISSSFLSDWSCPIQRVCHDRQNVISQMMMMELVSSQETKYQKSEIRVESLLGSQPSTSQKNLGFRSGFRFDHPQKRKHHCHDLAWLLIFSGQWILVCFLDVWLEGKVLIG